MCLDLGSLGHAIIFMRTNKEKWSVVIDRNMTCHCIIPLALVSLLSQVLILKYTKMDFKMVVSTRGVIAILSVFQDVLASKKFSRI